MREEGQAHLKGKMLRLGSFVIRIRVLKKGWRIKRRCAEGPRTWRRNGVIFHAMVFAFPKLSSVPPGKNCLYACAPEQLDGFGPLANEAPWVEGLVRLWPGLARISVSRNWGMSMCVFSGFQDTGLSGPDRGGVKELSARRYGMMLDARKTNGSENVSARRCSQERAELP